MRCATLALCAITTAPVALEAQSLPELVSNVGSGPFGLTDVDGTLYHNADGGVWGLTGTNAVPLAPLSALSWVGSQAPFVGMGGKVYLSKATAADCGKRTGRPPGRVVFAGFVGSRPATVGTLDFLKVLLLLGANTAIDTDSRVFA